MEKVGRDKAGNRPRFYDGTDSGRARKPQNQHQLGGRNRLESSNLPIRLEQARGRRMSRKAPRNTSGGGIWLQITKCRMRLPSSHLIFLESNLLSYEMIVSTSAGELSNKI